MGINQLGEQRQGESLCRQVSNSDVVLFDAK